MSIQPSSANQVLLTLTPNNPSPIPTERYIRLLVILSILLLLVLSAIVLERGLALIHHTVLLFALGALLAYALDPIVEWVRGRNLPSRLAGRWQLPRWLGIVAVFATVAVCFGLAVFLLGRETVHQTRVLIRDHDKLQMEVTQKLTDLDAYLHVHGVPVHVSDLIRNPPPGVKQWEAEAAKGSLSFASEFSKGAFEGVVVILIAIYLLLFSEELRGRTTNLFPQHVRPYISGWQDDVNRILGGFVRGQALLAVSLGIAAGIVCTILQLRFSVLIGVFVMVASLIPVIGPYIGTIPALLSAILTQHGYLSPGVRVVVVLLLFVAINEAGSKVIYPRLVGKALGLHEVVVLFVLLAGLEVGGIVGTLFAAPLTALAIATIRQLYRLWLGASAHETDAAVVRVDSAPTPAPAAVATAIPAPGNAP